MLQCHGDIEAPLDSFTLNSEAYVLANSGNPLDGLAGVTGSYPDAPWCSVDDFRRNARDLAATLSSTVLSMPSWV
jgi:hypothetical protein